MGKKERFVTKALQKLGQTKPFWILHASRRQLLQGPECFTSGLGKHLHSYCLNRGSTDGQPWTLRAAAVVEMSTL